ncbi:MAG: imidazole glycerol phosphate synthase subunit HisF [Phycisphaerales bacterium]|jgi:imidazole glycerol phosphate synthase glutamine amidotransferase subunit|nr:imidazole glycerol phosphate synthase subunit HisF [Phycisphaeraceae bacterium]
MTRTPSTSKGLPPSAAAMDDAAIIAPDSGKVADVTILSTGSANLASVVAAFERLGSRATITTDPLIAERAELLVLPGVGSLGSAMASLGQRGLIDMIRRRCAAHRPLLAICLGLQLLAEASDESPGVAGLGVIEGRAERFASSVRVPQMGWNRIVPGSGCVMLSEGDAYFANSYALRRAPLGWASATSTHDGAFIAAIERGPILACQFHPELSGAFGLSLLRRWLDAAGSRGVGTSTSTPTSGGALSRSSGLTRRVIPCLDVRAGRVVKGVRFANLVDSGDPAELAARYELQGADELTLLDVSATPEDRGASTATVRAVRRAISIPLTVGGGVRTIDDVSRLLDAGADKVAMNTAAVAKPDLLSAAAARFGTQCIVIAIDAARRSAGPDSAAPSWRVVVRSGTEHLDLDGVEWAARAAACGAGEVLLTSHDRDGTRSGYDTELLACVARAVGVPVIASGGAAGPEHFIEALRTGADAVLAAGIFHTGLLSIADAKRTLADAGIAMRLPVR